MNPLDRMPGPGPRGDRDGIDAFHAIAAFFGIALVLIAAVAIILLLWNSFKVRTEVRALRNEVARLASGGAAVGAATAFPSTPATPASAGVNTGLMAIPPTPPAAPPMPPAAPPTPPAAPPAPPQAPSETQPTPAAGAPAAKAPRAPRRKPAGPVE